jgi:PQQ-dependent dehydrogenase (methanol/ethanol family)
MLARLSLVVVLCAFLQAEDQFANLCASCHGEAAGGTDRGPALVNNRSLRRKSETQIQELIRTGTKGGMPAFPLPTGQLQSLARFVHSLNATAYEMNPAGDRVAGEHFFFGKGQCGSCHMVHGRGKSNGPDLSGIGRELTLREIELTLDNPTSQIGVRSTADCPGWAFCPQQPWVVLNVTLKSGGILRGYARSQGQHDLQLQTVDGKLHLLNDTEYSGIARETESAMPALKATAQERANLIAYLSGLSGVPVGPLKGEYSPIAQTMPKPGDWPSYNGSLNGNRYSTLNQINTANAGRLQLAWSYQIPYSPLEMTPLVSDGVMIVTGPNQVCALDSRSGRQIWCYTRPRNDANKISGDAALGANRGAALKGDRVYFETDNAHLICLNLLTGALIWEAALPELPFHYGSTSAPLVAGDLVIAGVAGGDAPLRGFLDAYNATTGERVWRFWTVPKPGEPKSETWKGKAIEQGGGATWFTGSYDESTGTLYWPTGNPFPDTDGDDREGTNLYTNCVIALDVKTGKLKWHYQFTPHDLHDWDATEPMPLVDTQYQGRDRKLLLQANRNGFFYVLDRTSGELLLGKPFVKKLTWSTGIGADGRPQLAEGNKVTRIGVKACPAVRGATNWYSTAFDPNARLFYVMAVEDCNIYQQSKLGGYVPYRDPSDPGQKFLRALNIETGKIVWEIPQVGPPESNYSGVLATAGGLVFYGETGGSFAAVESKTGKTLWHSDTGQIWKASPMTYMVNGRQYVAIAAGGTVFSFALP